MDRVREFGVLMAVGMKRIRVFMLIIFETFVLSIFGGLIGMGLGALTIWYLSDKGIDLSIFSEGLNAWGMPTQMYPVLPIYFLLPSCCNDNCYCHYCSDLPIDQNH